MIDTPSFSRAAVAAPHILAAEAGRAVLHEGGNAVEAMIAMAAAIPVVYPHMNAIGGDGFWLVRDRRGRVRYIEACGFAGAKATIAHYQERGHHEIPKRGPLAALTVPGAVGGWLAAHELARGEGGRMPVRDLLHHAIALARDGYPQSRSEARYTHRESDDLFSAPGFAAAFLVDGDIPAAGVARKAPALAATLAHLAKAGFDDFYRGDIGREIAADCEAIGSPVTRDDLARFRAVERAPLKLRLEGRTYYNSPPPTQGLASLVSLGVFDRLGVTQKESFAHIHGLIEAAKHGLAVRDRVVTDYERLLHDPADFLTPAFLARQAQRISMTKAAPFPLPAEKGDTIWMGAIDGDGLVVSYIQSIYWEYGSGCVLPRTGVLMQNRGTSFSLDPASVNPLQPGRRPFHTLNPPLCLYDEGRVLSYGAMGGDGQPQFQAQVLSRIELGEGLAGAIDQPRFLLGKTWGETSTTLKLESRFDPSLVRALENAGHAVELTPHAYHDSFGHAGALMLHPDGHIEAAHDPRSDGGAAGV